LVENLYEKNEPVKADISSACLRNVNGMTLFISSANAALKRVSRVQNLVQRVVIHLLGHPIRKPLQGISLRFISP
jgi:hypothetical protein